MKRRMLNLANSIVDGELLLLPVAVALIILPSTYAWNGSDGWPGPLVWAALGVMALPWLLRLLLTGTPTKSTILDVPLTFLLLGMGIGLWASISPAVTLRQMMVMVAGIAVYYAIVNRLRGAASVWLVAVVVIICGALLASALLVQFAWMRGAHTLMPILQRLGIAQGVTAEASTPWLDPGITAGVLSMVVPVAAALAIAGGHSEHAVSPALRWVLAASAVVLAILLVTCVILAQSWGELLAIVFTAIVLPALYRPHWRLFLVALAAAVICAGVLFWIIGTPALQSILPLRPWLRPVYPSRWEVWTRALYMIEAYPFTGIGMGAFATVAQNNFPYFEDGLNQLPHAHNLYLQTTLDGGVLAALSLLALIVVFYVGAWRSINADPVSSQSRDRAMRTLHIGLAGGFMVVLIAGIFDHAVLTDPLSSLVFWTMLGLAESVRQTRPVRTPVPGWASSRRARISWGTASIGLIVVLLVGLYWGPLASLFHCNVGNLCRDRGWLATDTTEQSREWAISALDSYRRALTTGWVGGLAYRSWGDLLFRAHHPESAIMRLEGTPGYTANDTRLAFWSQVARLTEGENAVVYLEQAAWMRPEDIFAHFFLAEAYRADGDTEEAARQYRAADVPTPMLLQEAAYYVGAGNTPLADASLETARLLSPDSVDVHHTAGVLRFLQGDFAGAVESFITAVSLAPDRHDLYWSLGEAYRRNGSWPEAATAYWQATSLAPDEARYHYSLARAYRKTDRTEEAIRSYEIVLALDPGNEAASRELAELRTK
jgi:tetratricopeptide (TPR) repeat protein/O-antigen ligase